MPADAKEGKLCGARPERDLLDVPHRGASCSFMLNCVNLDEGPGGCLEYCPSLSAVGTRRMVLILDVDSASLIERDILKVYNSYVLPLSYDSKKVTVDGLK